MSSYVGGFARPLTKERRRAFRKHWPLLVAITAGLCLLSATGLRWALGDIAIPAWMLGPVFVVAVMGALKTQLDGTYLLESSIDAEGWTSTDLRKALGPRWHVVDGVSFGAQGDADHVVVGPSGVFAVETKFTDSTMNSRTGRALVRSWIDQGYENAQRVRPVETQLRSRGSRVDRGRGVRDRVPEVVARRRRRAGCEEEGHKDAHLQMA
jgi:hypothetical protein